MLTFLASLACSDVQPADSADSEAQLDNEPGCADRDEDTHTDVACGGDDCNDNDPSVHPGADEIPYDGLDQDCDGQDLADVDGDGYEGDGGLDCDDEDPDIHPGADEVAKDGIDQDCDGVDDLDGDGDGFDDEAFGGEDCDDEDPSVHPDAHDWMSDGVDADCDGIDGQASTLDALTTLTGEGDFGRALAVCDLDEDGRDDLVVSAPGVLLYSGEISVFYDLDAAPTVIPGGDREALGYEATCGDLDGDGHLDLVVEHGEILYEDGYYDSHFRLAYIWGDGTRWPAEHSTDVVLEHQMGVPDEPSIRYAPLSIGDLDRDGSDEVVLAYGGTDTTRYDGGERMLVVPGTRHAYDAQLEDVLSHWMIPPQDGELTRARVLSDVDTNGASDVAILAAGHDDGNGRLVHLFGLPSPGGVNLLDLDHLSFEGAGGFGWDAVEGDFDGDGVGDLVVLGEAGGLWLLSDLATELVDVGVDPDAVATAWGSGLHTVLDAPGDLDGDGCDDLVVVDDDAVHLVSGALLSGEIEAWSDVSLGVWTGSALDVDHGDIDGDRQVDLVVSDAASDTVYLVLSTERG
ncbi:MAG: hypothetical protein GY913_26800 [Proteobacteria bacterium]|nr:hypothetical protein [Pseudomonadota bacterium]